MKSGAFIFWGAMITQIRYSYQNTLYEEQFVIHPACYESCTILEFRHEFKILCYLFSFEITTWNLCLDTNMIVKAKLFGISWRKPFTRPN